MLMKKAQRLIAALVLVGFVGSTGLSITAEASSHNNGTWQEQRYDHDKKYNQDQMKKIKREKEQQRIARINEERRIARINEERRIARQREDQRIARYNAEQRRSYQWDDNETHSDTGNLVTGLIIGGIIGSIISNNS